MAQYMTTREIAAELGVHAETVRRWIRAGLLAGIPFGHAGYRVAASDFQNFLVRKQYAGMTTPRQQWSTRTRQPMP